MANSAFQYPVAGGGGLTLTGNPVGGTGAASYSFTYTLNGGAGTSPRFFIAPGPVGTTPLTSPTLTPSGVNLTVTGTYPSAGGTFELDIGGTDNVSNASAFSYKTLSVAPSGADPYFSFVQNLFPISESNGSQTITDVITGQTWTFGGTVAVNSGYLVCDGSGGSSSHAITVGPQTGTPVVWVHEFFGIGSTSSAPGYAMFCFNSGRGLFYQTQSLQYYQSGQLGITGAMTLNTLTHFALFYDLSNWYLARDGIVEATFTAPEQYFEFFGIAEDFSGGFDYLNQFKLGPIRTTVGSLRGYSSAGFTPPTTPFPNH